MSFAGGPTPHRIDKNSQTYLGRVSVKPRKDVRWFFESASNHNQITTSLKRRLRDNFALPAIGSVDRPSSTDLGLDITILYYSTGVFFTVSGELFIPIFWRPIINLSGKLYRLDNDIVVKAVSIKERASWRDCFSHAFSRLSGSASLFGEEQMLVLLNRASLRLLHQLTQ
jgi:hypothetical protein